MAVPPFLDFMLPLLVLAGDGKEHELRTCYEFLADQLGLSPEDREDRIPSGKKTRLQDRVQWSSTYLRKTGLLESTGRGLFRITDRGREVLADNPQRIDLKYLSRFPELEEFRSAKRDSGSAPSAPTESDATPEEQLDSIHQELDEALALEVLDLALACSPRFFEQLVVEMLVAMGYGGSLKDAGQAVGRSGDEGIDGIIKEDRLGLDAVYIQAKRWKDTVGRPVVQAFAGSLEGHRARKGVLITTSSFSKEAEDFVKRIEKRIVLIDGQQLARHMIELNIGVTPTSTYTIKRVDNDYFE